MLKKITATIITALILTLNLSLIAFGETHDNEEPTYLKAVISTEESIEIQKSTIFESSQSYIPNPDREIKYHWDFGDGNKNEGSEVLHAYKSPGRYQVKLVIDDGHSESETTQEVFAYKKLIVLITDQTEAKERINIIKNFAENEGVFTKVIESFGSSTEFISEEVLAKKMTEQSTDIQKASQIIVWTKENAGLNALSRFILNNQNKLSKSFAQKSIALLDENISRNINRVQRQFELIQPKNIVIAKEAALYRMIDSNDDIEFINLLKAGGYEYQIVNANTGKLRPWNFMSYFVNILINNGIPDNTIALLLLLPVIATTVAFMKQVVGTTTFGIYTPSIITLSFLVIGMHAGLLTLITAILVGAASRPILKKIRMLFIPKVAIVITLVSLSLFVLLIASTYLGLFDAEFLSIAIFPMLILSTLVEKFVSSKDSKGMTTAAALMASTVFVSIIAYFIAGGEIDLGFVNFRFTFVKNILMSYPELVILLLGVNVLLGRWTGLRIMETIRFREVLRHIEE